MQLRIRNIIDPTGRMNGEEVSIIVHSAERMGIYRNGSSRHVPVPLRIQILRTVSGELQHTDAVLIEKIEGPPNGL